MEHRWGYRLRVSIPVEICTRHGVVIGPAQVENLSVSGAFLVADQRLRLLTQVQVVFRSRGNGMEPGFSTATGYVARQHSLGFGLEWCDTESVEVAGALLLDAVGRDSETPAVYAPNDIEVGAPPDVGG